MSKSFDEPTIPPWLRRPLAAVWISLGLHAAVIALVQVAPPATMSVGEPVIEARLVSSHATPAATETLSAAPEEKAPEDAPKEVPLLSPSETAETPPVVKPVTPAPTEPGPHAVAQPPISASAAPPPAAAAPAPAATITSSVDLTYYSARQVDVQARPLREFDLKNKYPDAAARKRLSGKVRLNVKIEADGRVSSIELISATHPDLYDESKLQAILDTPFSPAIKNGRPVRELYQLEVEYDWEGQPR